jgi:high-affinity iron transporter
LGIYGLHELTEANLWQGSEALHWATEPYGPDGRYGQLLSYMLLALPVGWLAFSALFGPRKPPSAAPSPGLGQTVAR